MNMNRPLRAHLVVCLLAILVAFLSVFLSSAVWAQEPSSLELSRPIRPWEFLSATGQRASLLGSEAGRFEAWVYPLKILRDFHLRFRVGDREIPAEALARTLTIHPESSSILYASDTFTVRETFFVPVHEAGAVILIDVDTSEPVEVEAVFHRDFQLEWPAALGGTYMSWNADEHAFVLGEETKKYVALVGSPTTEGEHAEYQTSYSTATESSFRLGATKKGHETKVVVVAASLKDRAEAESEYRHLTTSYAALLQESAAYYRDYLARTVNLALPDEQLQQAYDWSRVSMVQGWLRIRFSAPDWLLAIGLRAKASVRVSRGFLGATRNGPNLVSTPWVISIPPGRRSISSVNFSAMTVKCHMRLRSPPASCLGLRITRMGLRRRMLRRCLSSLWTTTSGTAAISNSPSPNGRTWRRLTVSCARPMMLKAYPRTSA